MRAREFIQEDASAGSTAAGSIASVAQSLGAPIRRLGLMGPAKYMNSLKRMTKKHVNRRS